MRESERQILEVIRMLGGKAHGAAIAKAIAEASERIPSFAAIYNRLSKLRRQGFVTSEYGEATPVRGGRRKLYWLLTERAKEGEGNGGNGPTR